MANEALNYYDATNYGMSTNNEDNSTALQALIDKIYALGGGTIYIPNGEYHFANLNTTYSVKLKPNVSIVGENKFLTRLIMDEASVGYSLFYRIEGSSYPLKNAMFKDFTVDASAMTVWETRSKAFYAQYIEDCTFKDLVLIGTPATAMGIDMLTNVLIDSIICKDCGKMWVDGRNGSSGIGIGCGGYEHENITISNCICIGSGQYGIFVEEQKPHDWGGKYDTTKGVNIINNVVRNGLNCGIGVRGMTGVTITGNTVYSNAKYGIYTDGGYEISISGNTVFDNLDSGIAFNPYTCNIANVLVSGNNITGNKNGISIQNDSDNLTNSGITIIGNFTRENADYSISLLGKITDICIKGNGLFEPVSNNAVINGDSLFDNDVPVNTLGQYDSECKYKLDSASAYTYKMILLLSGTYYLYCSNSPFYIYTDGDNHFECFKLSETKRCTTNTESSGGLSSLAGYDIELDNGYVHHSQNKRSLSSFVWANHDLLQYGTDTVLVTAGSHE